MQYLKTNFNFKLAWRWQSGIRAVSNTFKRMSLNKNILLKAGRKRLTIAVCLSLLFAGALQRAPLFTSNQNTYLLKGVSEAIGEPLSNDWLTNQTDHIRLFSWLTKISFKTSPTLFYIYHALLSFVLIFSLYLIAEQVSGASNSYSSTANFFLLFFLAERYFSVFSGVAGQYILGAFFQPSDFGVFLIASIAFFCFDRHVIAILCCLLAAYFHPTYTLQAGFLTLTYQAIMIQKKSFRCAIGIGVIALIAISPLLYHLYDSFGGLSPAIVKRAQEILVYERIPHHAVISEWLLSRQTVFALALLSSAIFVYRQDRNIVLLITVPLALSFGFIALAAITNNLTMLLMFGQRSSVWLIPLTASLLIGRIAFEIKWHQVFNLSIRGLLILTIFIMVILSIRGTLRTITLHRRLS